MVGCTPSVWYLSGSLTLVWSDSCGSLHAAGLFHPLGRAFLIRCHIERMHPRWWTVVDFRWWRRGQLETLEIDGP